MEDWRVQKQRYNKAEVFVSFNPSTTSREVCFKLSTTIFHWFLSFQDILYMCISLVWLNHILKLCLPWEQLCFLANTQLFKVDSGLYSLHYDLPWKHRGLKLFHRSKGLPLLSWSNLMPLRSSEKDSESLYALGIRILSLSSYLSSLSLSVVILSPLSLFPLLGDHTDRSWEYMWLSRVTVNNSRFQSLNDG